MDFELKPCPFCGGKAGLFVQEGVRVICVKCNATTRILVDGLGVNGMAGNATKSVIDAWNSRVELPHNHSQTPECYGFYRSPQSDAENCCEDCARDADCYLAYSTRRFICTAKCPELDIDSSPHCKCSSSAEITMLYEKYPDGCPVGNTPIWEDCDSETIDNPDNSGESARWEARIFGSCSCSLCGESTDAQPDTCPNCKATMTKDIRK